MKEYSNEDVIDRIEAIRKTHGRAGDGFNHALDCVLRSFGLLGDAHMEYVERAGIHKPSRVSIMFDGGEETWLR